MVGVPVRLPLKPTKQDYPQKQTQMVDHPASKPCIQTTSSRKAELGPLAVRSGIYGWILCQRMVKANLTCQSEMCFLLHASSDFLWGHWQLGHGEGIPNKTWKQETPLKACFPLAGTLLQVFGTDAPPKNGCFVFGDTPILRHPHDFRQP